MIAIRIFEIAFPIFAIVTAGLLYARKFNPDMSLPNKMNMDVFVPALLFIVVYEQSGATGLFGNLALAVTLVVLLSGIVSIFVARLFHMQAKTLVPPIMFSNSANLGIPLVVLSFGEAALSTAVICFVVCNFFHITIVNIWLNKQRNLLNVFLNPMVITVILAAALSILEVEIPVSLLEPIRMLGDICVPLMLFALGVRLLEIKITEWKIGMLAAILAPVVGIAVVVLVIPFIELTRIEQGALFLFGVLPPAVMNYIFAEYFEQEPAKVAAIVLFGNAFSIISIPIALAYVLPRFG